MKFDLAKFREQRLKREEKKRQKHKEWLRKWVILGNIQKVESGCWNYTGRINVKGYGYVSMEGKSILAHRYSYALHKGDFDQTLLVCHTCDNPRCVNPAHLFLGTNKDNTYDSISKGRFYQLFTKGNLPGNSKIKDAKKVKEIRLAIKQGIPISKIASAFGVSRFTVYDIKEGRSYINIPDQP